MKHRASPRFWRHYRALPEEIQQLADRGYDMVLQDPRHPPCITSGLEDSGQPESACIIGRLQLSVAARSCGCGLERMRNMTYCCGERANSAMQRPRVAVAISEARRL